MPNANVLKQKQEQVAALAEKMKNSAAGVVVPVIWLNHQK